LATDAPGTAHSATTCALKSLLYRRRAVTLSLVIASTYSYVDTILIDASLKLKMGSPRAYELRDTKQFSLAWP
jgi:hypothetical protein